jgi:hypothetical protein
MTKKDPKYAHLNEPRLMRLAAEIDSVIEWMLDTDVVDLNYEPVVLEACTILQEVIAVKEGGYDAALLAFCNRVELSAHCLSRLAEDKATFDRLGLLCDTSDEQRARVRTKNDTYDAIRAAAERLASGAKHH